MEGKKGCPFHLGKLLPNAEDRSAKVISYRKAVLDDAQHFVEEDLATASTEGIAFHDDMRVSLGSVFLNYFWERLKEEPILKEKVTIDEDFWHKLLANALGQSYNAIHRYFLAVVNDYNSSVFFSNRTGQNISFSDFGKVNMVRGQVNRQGRTSEDKELGFPVFGDLFKFCFKFFQLVYELFKEQLPEEQVDEAFKKYLAGNDLMLLLQGFMNNDKETARMITLNLIDPQDKENVQRFIEQRDLKKRGSLYGIADDETLVNELSRFDKKKFEFDVESSKLGGSRSLKGNVATLRFIYKYVPRNKIGRRSCPALYTGMWPQMYDWARRLMLYQMYDEPYPTPEDLPQSRLEKTQPNLVARFRIGVRESLAKHIEPEAAEIATEIMASDDFKPYQPII